MSPLKKRRPSSSTFLGSVDSGAAAAQSRGSSFEGVFSRYTVTTHCGHRFHLDCLQSTRSFEMSNCPMCREELPPGITPAKKSAIAGSRALGGGVNVIPSAANSASSPSALRDAAHNGAGGPGGGGGSVGPGVRGAARRRATHEPEPAAEVRHAAGVGAGPGRGGDPAAAGRERAANYQRPQNKARVVGEQQCDAGDDARGGAERGEQCAPRAARGTRGREVQEQGVRHLVTDVWGRGVERGNEGREWKCGGEESGGGGAWRGKEEKGEN